MNHFCRYFSLLVSLPALLPPLRAADLSNIERTIVKEPAYRSSPKYCLLLFGLGTDRRVWLVLDGKQAYIDRNGNGDLTDDGETAQAKRVGQGQVQFELGDIPDGECVHKQLRVVVEDLKHLSDQYEEANVLVARNPEARMYKLWLDTEMPGIAGSGVAGRVKQRVNAIDRNGVLQFSGDPVSAPVINFGGAWQFLLEERPQLVAGRRADLFMAIGTPGIGPGSTAYIAHEGLVPESAKPSIVITLPAKDPRDEPLEMRCAESDRGCVYSFHSAITVPDAVGTGLSAIGLSLEGWNENLVIPSEDEVEICSPRPGPPASPIFPRLVRRLIHPSRRFLAVNLHFSPDGERIISGSYPDGVVQVWDTATGDELSATETGYALRRSSRYLVLSPNWRTFFVSRNIREVTPIDREGQQLWRWQFDGDVRAWDVDTGQLRHTYKHDPPRGIDNIDLSPDGTSFVTEEELSGESAGQPAAARSLWDVTSGKPRALPQMSVGGYSPDGKVLAAFESDFAGETSRVNLIDVETAAVSRSLRMNKPANHRIYHLEFSPNGNSLLGLLGVPDGSVDWRVGLWDFATGRALATLDQDRYQEGVFSPSGEILANTNFQRKGPAKIYLLDTLERKLRHAIMLDEHGYAYRPVFSPDGKWIAIATQQYIDGMRTIDPDCPQARIHLIDVSIGTIRETLVAPCGPIALAFHPSGTMLASSGYGFVHLWDLKAPPIRDGTAD